MRLNKHIPVPLPRQYSNLRFTGDYSTKDIADGKCFTVSVDVENRGDRVIRETVCMYLAAKGQTVMRRKKELADFKCVNLQPGEKKTVELSLGKRALSYLDQDGKRRLGQGRFVISAGVNPDEELQTELHLDGIDLAIE